HTTTASNEIMGIWCRNGYIYCTGYFQGDMKWNSASTQVTAQGFQDAFIASVYISTFINTITYANDFIQAGNDEDEYIGAGSSDPGWKECGYGICANGTAVYVTGNLSEDGATPLFDGTAYDGAGAFFARINYSGSVLGAVSWVRESENLSGDPVTRSIGYGIAVDALGNVFATGRCFDDVRLEGSGGGNGPIDIWTAGGCPGFIARYTSTGDIISAEPINQVTELTSNCEGRSITVNGCEVFTTGWVQLNSFQAGNLATATVGASKTAMYIFEFSRDAMISNDIVYCEACASFPNVLNLSASGGAAASYTYAWAPGTYLSSTSSATPTFSMTSCSNSGTTNYVCTITTTVTNYCSATASVSVTAGSTAVGVANAGPDKLVCPLTNYTLGTNMPDGLTYYWEPQYHLTNWNTDQPTYYNTVALSSPITYTVEVTDVCGNVSYDYVTVSNNPLCPHRFANPNQKKAEVFPNPSTGIFSVNLGVEEEEADVEFVVTDLSGRVVQQSTVTTAGGLIPLDLSGEAKGVYILSVTRNGETEVHKLTVE
ncbi:MAG TPA: T9SS type A sorting domain-containing protein, partial [Bacteroidia bacterium]|nr:T9SS type A sorting domain-containing protein [Bacteroidia bacterium]